jgi:hypothetical protein
VRRAGLGKAEPGADAGPGAAQRRRLIPAADEAAVSKSVSKKAAAKQAEGR